MKIFRIAKWSETFETAESRKCKTLRWISMPTGFGSNGYQLLIDTFGVDAPAIYGAWCALASYAASCEIRGTLATSAGEPIPINRIARITHLPSSVFERLFDWASSKDVNWLEVIEKEEIEKTECWDDGSGEKEKTSVAIPAGQCLPDNTGPDITEHNNTGPDRTQPKARSGFFQTVSKEILQSTPKLLEWFDNASKNHPDVIAPSEDNRVRVVVAAECALEKGKNPAAYFIKLMTDPKWNLTQAQEDRARKRVRELERGPPPTVSTKSDGPKQISFAQQFKRITAEKKAAVNS